MTIACLKDAGKLQNTNVDLNEVCRNNKQGVGSRSLPALSWDLIRKLTGAGSRLINFAEKNHIPELFTTLLQAAQGH